MFESFIQQLHHHAPALSVLASVRPELLAMILRVVVRGAVAVVVFEGGLRLNVGELRHTSRAVVGLVSVVLLITTMLAGLLVKFLLGWSWELSLLFGAIVSVRVNEPAGRAGRRG